MSIAVVKLGSSIVADERGEVRTDVLAQVCDQAAELYRAGHSIVLVTSGAIARGMRLMELPVRPSAMSDLQAASAVGQGRLYRAYDELLHARGVPSAQVLLTFFDMSARSHYLNARQTLRTLLDWRVVPVINENDTTTTDEISFGDNDFLAAQVAVLIGADLLVLLTDVDGLFTASPRLDPDAERDGDVGAEPGRRTTLKLRGQTRRESLPQDQDHLRCGDQAPSSGRTSWCWSSSSSDRSVCRAPSGLSRWIRWS